MGALNWIKERTETKADEPLTVEGVTYDVERSTFTGRLPRRMIAQLCKEKLEVTDTVYETVYVERKSGFTQFTRTTYTPRAA